MYVPTSDTGYWLVIDMDESRRPNTAIIEWNHPLHGNKLGFHHDLFQLGKLMGELEFALTTNLKNIRDILLSAEYNPDLTARGILAQLQGNSLVFIMSSQDSPLQLYVTTWKRWIQ